MELGKLGIRQLPGVLPTMSDFSDSELEPRGFVGEVWDFLRVRKKFWLAPIIVALMLLGALIVFAGSAGVVSPFVYMM